MLLKKIGHCTVRCILNEKHIDELFTEPDGRNSPSLEERAEVNIPKRELFQLAPVLQNTRLSQYLSVVFWKPHHRYG